MNSIVRTLTRRQNISRDNFLEAMSKTASSVNIITTNGQFGRAGMTISSMTSVSADTQPPSLLVCLNRSSLTCTAILNNGTFCVNVLRDTQSHISDVFAGKSKTIDGDKFSCTEWTIGSNRSPRMVDCLVSLECRVAQSHPIGTHQVVIGKVIDVFIAADNGPLIYANRNYGKFVCHKHAINSDTFNGMIHVNDNVA